MNKFSGLKYKLYKSDKFEEYMKAIGVGVLARKVGKSLFPTFELIVDGDNYTIKASSSFKNTVINFKLGEEFEQETPDGRRIKSVINIEGDNKLVEVHKGEKVTKIVREFTRQEVKMTLTVDDVVCTRIYKLIE